MRENYTCEPDVFEGLVLGIGGVLFTVIWLLLCFTIDVPRIITMTIAAVIILIAVMLSIEIQETNFDANDTQVTFSRLRKNTVIRYADITNIKLERRNNEYGSRSGMVRDYIETLTITTKEKTHVFSAKMVIDYDKVDANPADLTVQFENSKFSRLKNCIEERIYINI
ncbi:hypothetical protein [Ruminococcus albus]|uniref:PH domain-containing protein n=1 Tax=Ruminococcus albus TaxID=1264 RepID=A0A1H7GJL5_RUMAL|nr:hypothetical protein [Ruminococcus albus]SEK37717.1 hypothetical protein SAMN05216469_102116 [Ruminococcus albus]